MDRFDRWTTLSRRVKSAAKQLRQFISPFEAHPNVGESRDLGLLLGIESAKNKSTREPFPKEQNVAEKIRQAMLWKNVLDYPAKGCVDGLRGDHILLAPPFLLASEESRFIAGALRFALEHVFASELG